MPEEPNPSEPPSAPNASVSVPDHELIRLIGKGSYGQVWLARNTLGTFRAVKIVYEQTFRHKSPFEREFRGVEKFEPVSRLHDGLVDILQVGRNEKSGYFYCVMELADDAVSGPNLTPGTYTPRTLAFEAAKHQRLPVAECLRIGERIASALALLHERGLIHRDVKPSNIIFVNAAPKLADVGLVAELADARSYVGTDGFIPPEGPGSVSADIYSLGKVLYEVSTGKDRRDYPELPTRLDDAADEEQLAELNKIILKACRSAPEQRYRSAEKMRVDLLAVQAGRRISGSGQRGWRLAGWLGGGLCLTLVACAFWFLNATRNSADVLRPAGLVGLWRAEGNGLDAAGTNDGVLYGVAFAEGLVGRAFDFVPPWHRVRIPDNPDFKLTNSLTIEGWIFMRTGQGFILHRGDSRPGLDPYTLGAGGPGQILFNINQSLTNYLNLVAPIAYRRWQHVAATLDGDSGEAKIYVDGALAAQTNTAIRPLGDLDPAYAPSIGIGNVGPLDINYSFDGLIDEVALYSRALTAAEVQGLYRAGREKKAVLTSNRRPPPLADGPPAGAGPVLAPHGLIAWWRGEGDASDVLGANPGIASGGLSYASGVVGQAFRFNGSNAFVKIPKSPTLEPGAEVTIEFWMKADLDNPMNTCCQGLVGSDFYLIEISSEILTGVNFGLSTDGRTFSDMSQVNNRAAMVSSGVWHHVAGTYDGSALQLYIDGDRWGKPMPHSGPISLMLSASSLAIGSEDGRTICPGCNGTRYFKGLIDEVAIYNRALTAAEVQSIYAAGSAGKTLESKADPKH